MKRSLLLAALWSLAGLPAQAQFSASQVADLHVGSGDSNPEELTDVGGVLYFAADDGALGRELWKTTGVGAPTLVKDINPSGFSFIDEATALGNLLIFEADDGAAGRELWRSDGTGAGTFQLTTSTIGVQDLVLFGSDVIFSHTDFTYGRELWKSDGTLGGTVLVADVRPGFNGSGPYPGGVVGGDFFFWADDGSIGYELYKTDGTMGGTGLVLDLWPGLNPGGADPGVALGGIFYFTGQDPNGRELWRSDGTAAGTWMIKDIRPGIAASWPMDFTVSGGRLFFTADDGTNGREPWVSDGTTAGTVLLKDIDPGPASSKPFNDLYYMLDVGGTLFFYADDGVSGAELWKSDGTTSGTVMVTDLYPGPNDCKITGGIDAGGVLYFGARNNVVGDELFRSDGTAAGTYPVTDLWAGTWSSSPTELTISGSRVYFSATDGSSGRELWALEVCELQAPVSYCTPGTSASGCTALLGATGVPSASAASGFDLLATGVEGQKDGLFFFGANGRQANTWGNGTSLQCVVPPVKRTSLNLGTGLSGLCNGAFSQDLNAHWTFKPAHNPGAGAVVQAQLWYRDPFNTSNQTTSLSDAIEFLVCP